MLQAPPGNRHRLEPFCLAVTAAGQNSGADPMNTRRSRTAISRQTRTADMLDASPSDDCFHCVAGMVVMARNDQPLDDASFKHPAKRELSRLVQAFRLREYGCGVHRIVGVGGQGAQQNVPLSDDLQDLPDRTWRDLPPRHYALRLAAGSFGCWEGEQGLAGVVVDD